MTASKVNFIIHSPSAINVIFALFPISFIFGNLVTNVNFLIFCILGLFILRSSILFNKINIPLKAAFLFFLLVFFSTTLNFILSIYSGEYEQSNLPRLIKSVLFFRFFIILLIIYFLSELNIINYKYFFFSAALSPLIISLDIIFQYIFGFNTIGIESLGNHNSSFFGEELISGGYVQNFSFFSVMLMIFLTRNSNRINRILLNVFVISILATAILVSGNRMPFYLFLLGLLLLFFLGKDIKKILRASICSIAIIFSFICAYDENIKGMQDSFYSNVESTSVAIAKKIKNSIFSKKKESKEIVFFKKCKLDENKSPPQYCLEKLVEWDSVPGEDPELNPYRKLFFTGIEVWKKSKIYGHGIKSFRVECKKIVDIQKRGLCSNHPHNYYVEILTDLGMAGFLLAIIIGLIFIIFLVRNYTALRKTNNLENLFLLAGILSLTLATFPFRSTGSIFTTNNITYIILICSIIISYKKLLKGENFK